MKFLLPILLIALTNVNQMVRCQLSVPDDAAKQCFIGVHCLLGPEVRARAVNDCARKLDRESLLELERWLEMEGYEDIVGMDLEEFIDMLCAVPEEEKEKVLEALSPKFMKAYSENCQNPFNPDCTLYNNLMDCYFDIYGEEKPKNNCGYPEDETV